MTLQLLLLTAALLPHLSWSASLTQVALDLSSIGTANSRLNAQPYAVYSPKGLGWCAKECKKKTVCRSFNYRFSNFTCELYDQDGDQVLSDDDSLFSSVQNWPNAVLGPCGSMTCPQSTTCETNNGNEAVCVETECKSDPPTVSKSSASVSSRDIGQQSNYTCDPGSFLVGSPSATCAAPGVWTNVKFSCKVCGAPPQVQQATPSDSTGTLDTNMTYSCDNDADLLNGPAQVLCDSQADWATPTFSCFKTQYYKNSGTVYSPGYPGNYDNNQDINITITLEQPGPQNVSVSITYNTESCCDYVQIAGEQFQGTSSNDTIVGVSNDTLIVIFHSNESVVKEKGFILTYNVN